MATGLDVYKALRDQITTATTGLQDGGQPISVQVGLGWPHVNALQNIGKNKGCLISLFDSKTSKNLDVGFPRKLGTINTATGIVTTKNKTEILAGQTGTITLSGTPVANDGVSCIVAKTRGLNKAAIHRSATVLTTAAFATALRDAINSEPMLAGLVTATATGSVVTITNISGVTLIFDSRAGNISTDVYEMRKVMRHSWVVCWAYPFSYLEIVSTKLEKLLGQLTEDGTMALSDGSKARLNLQGDRLFDEVDVAANVFRQDFYADVSYSLTREDQVYSILAGILTGEANEIAFA